MRDLSLIEVVPTREQLRERIPRKERFRPEPRLIVEPQLKMREDGTGDVWLPRKQKWKQIHPIQIAALQAFAQGKDLAAAIEAAKPACPPKHEKHAEKYVRKFAWKLHKGGVMEVPLEAPPEVFAGRYRRVKELGRGGMGVVHLCHDEAEGDHPVVVKHAWGWNMDIERAELATREEAQALSRLDHPRIPGLRDIFEVEGLLHMVREYADGEGVPALAGRGAFADLGVRMATLRACADILRHIHDRGMLYMDVKPDNFVMASVEGGPFLLDMGLCRTMTDGVVKLRGAIGSPGFVAPELLKTKEARPASDVYGLGRMFAQLATQQRLRPKHKEPELLAFLDDAKLDPAERDLLARMCADEPERRLPTMDAVIDAIP